MIALFTILQTGFDFMTHFTIALTKCIPLRGLVTAYDTEHDSVIAFMINECTLSVNLNLKSFCWSILLTIIKPLQSGGG